MAIIIEGGGGNYEKAPEGVHRAVCVGIWDMGTQPGGMYGPKRTVMLTWELIDETNSKGEPHLVSEKYTMNLGTKGNLRPKIEAMRGKPLNAEEEKRFDLASMLGRPCQVQIVHNASKTDSTKIYANVGAVMAMPKGSPPMQPATTLSQYSITDGESFPEGMSDYVKNKIRESHEFKSKAGAEAVKNDVAEAYEKHATKAAPAAQPAGSALPWESGQPAY